MFPYFVSLKLTSKNDSMLLLKEWKGSQKKDTFPVVGHSVQLCEFRVY